MKKNNLVILSLFIFISVSVMKFGNTAYSVQGNTPSSNEPAGQESSASTAAKESTPAVVAVAKTPEVKNLPQDPPIKKEEPGLFPLGLYQLTNHPNFSNYAFLVNKQDRMLTVYEGTGTTIKSIAQFPADIGKSGGNKTRRNDFKTPEGIYFLESKLTSPAIDFNLYGSLAFTTSYPNIFDKYENKTGSGIWLHAIPDTVPLTRGSKGCVVVRDEVIKKLSQFVKLEQTPILIFDEVKFVKEEEHKKHQQELNSFLADWKESWEKGTVDKYMTHYDPAFRGQKMNYDQWKTFKESLKKKYEYVKIEILNPSILENRNQVVIKALQKYTSDQHTDYGQKTLFAHKTKEGIKIIREDWAPLKEEVLTSGTTLSSETVKNSGLSAN
jgi:murein L,D-transpeptidase YafK